MKPDASAAFGQKETKAERRERLQAERQAQDAVERARAQRNQRLGWLGGLVLAAGAVVVVVVVLFVNPGGGKSAIKTTAGEAVPGETFVRSLFAGIPEQGNALGAPKAPVTMQIYADAQCPYCGMAFRSALPQLVAQYVRPGKVRFVIHTLDFIGPDSHTAALAEQAAAQQNLMFPFAFLWYQNQQEENSGYVTPAFINKIAGGAGTNVAKLNTDRNDPQAQAAIDDANNLANSLSISSTPTFLLSRSGGVAKVFTPSSLTDPNAYRGALNQAIAQAG